jgi:hypothetical protein
MEVSLFDQQKHVPFAKVKSIKQPSIYEAIHRSIKNTCILFLPTITIVD